LRLLIEYLSRETQAARIHILGYSSGTRVVVAALAQMALMNAHKTEAEIHKQYRLGNVILVGSDVDRGLFGAHVRDGLLKVADRFSIYLSESDRALRISNLFFGHDRLGRIMQSELAKPEINQFLNAIPNLSVIDVSNAEKSSTGNGHAYFRDSPWVSSDILSTLLYDLSPEQRGLVRTAEQPVWRFPPDYIHRLSTTLANINPALRGLMEK
jgi:esterase/lipase superfamily enzyme